MIVNKHYVNLFKSLFYTAIVLILFTIDNIFKIIDLSIITWLLSLFCISSIIYQATSIEKLIEVLIELEKMINNSLDILSQDKNDN